jgi:hypothetical protein
MVELWDEILVVLSQNAPARMFPPGVGRVGVQFFPLTATDILPLMM